MYKIDIDNKQEVLLRLTLDNEDDEIKDGVQLKNLLGKLSGRRVYFKLRRLAILSPVVSVLLVVAVHFPRRSCFGCYYYYFFNYFLI